MAFNNGYLATNYPLDGIYRPYRRHALPLKNLVDKKTEATLLRKRKPWGFSRADIMKEAGPKVKYPKVGTTPWIMSFDTPESAQDVSGLRTMKIPMNAEVAQKTSIPTQNEFKGGGSLKRKRKVGKKRK